MHRVVIALVLVAMASVGQAMNERLGHQVSIKDFGAQGDGVTDDTAAIQRGLDSACGDSFTISSASGAGVSPIIVTTATAHNFLNGSLLRVANVGGNTNANGHWLASVLSSTTVSFYNESGEPSVGNAEYRAGGTIAAPLAEHLYFPAGTYNISSPLVTRCDMFLSGDGPAKSVIFQTHQYRLIHGIVANYSLRMEDIAVNTAPLTVDYSMIGVFAGSPAASRMGGDRFTFVRFRSAGFNFGLDINGTSTTDLVDSINVDGCDISVGTQENAVSQPIAAANATSLRVENSTLTGDSLPDGAVRNDHAIYTIAVRGVVIQNNLIQNQGNSAIKLLQGGFHDAACPTTQDYTSWTINNNRIVGSRLGIAVYAYCGLVMPSVVISNNVISNIPNTYLGDYAAVYVEANCESNFAHVLSSGNMFTNLGLGGIVLLSQIQNDNTCAAANARGTISSFTSVDDTFQNWSTSALGTFPAINSNGQNLMHASVSRLKADGSANGNRALNLSSFGAVDIEDAN